MNLELYELCQDSKGVGGKNDIRSPVGASSRVNSLVGNPNSSGASTRNSSQGRRADAFKQKEKLKKKKKTLAFKNVKEMVIDFICREDLIITTLKEFFEIFISSIKKD